MSGITFDEARWPLLVVHLSGVPTPAQFEQYLARRLEQLELRQRHVVVYDTRKALLITPEMRQRHTQWSHEHEALRREYVLGNALLITSPFFRLTMNVVLAMRRSRAVPYCVAADLPHAALWAADRLFEGGAVESALRLRQDFELSARLG